MLPAVHCVWGLKNVSIVYRRSEEEMPARKEEVHHAKEEGICVPVPDAILLRSRGMRNGNVTGLEVRGYGTGRA